MTSPSRHLITISCLTLSPQTMKLTCALILAAIWLPMLATASRYERSVYKTSSFRETNNEDLVVPLPECNDKYRALSDHTICKPPSALLKSGGVSLAKQQQIVDLHNKLRRQPYPKNATIFGAQMQAMVWDDNIAVIAQALANTCVFDHDKNRNVIGYGYGIGQNLAIEFNTWEEAIGRGWFAEYYNFILGQGSTNGQVVGHYTAMVKEDSSRIGCGFAKCAVDDEPDSDEWTYYVCNYAKIQSNMKTPFQPGQPCQSCPDKCSNRLCDCKGKICEHDGVLDLNTCACNCPPLWNGSPRCTKLVCPAKDKSFCGNKQFPPSSCRKSSNVPSDCPYMCGICTKP